LKLAEQVGGFILKRVVLFEFFILKNVWNTTDTISAGENGRLKQKEPWP
jgi:hypothetical protein